MVHQWYIAEAFQESESFFRFSLIPNNYFAKNKRALGSFGEALACGRLKRKGFSLLQRNWKCSQGEVDLVFFYRKKLIVTEVKTRLWSKKQHFLPEASLTPQKLERLNTLRKKYLSKKRILLLRKRTQGSSILLASVRIHPTLFGYSVTLSLSKELGYEEFI